MSQGKVLGVIAMLMASFGILYAPVLSKLVADWSADDNYSHGFLIVPIALYFAWERRARLAAPAPKGSWVGLLILLMSIGLLIVGLDPGQKENGELVSHLREGKDWVDLPILLIGDKRQEDCRGLPEAGGCAWLDKPFRMHEIHAMVESLLRDVAGTGVREAGSVERPRDA